MRKLILNYCQNVALFLNIRFKCVFKCARTDQKSQACFKQAGQHEATRPVARLSDVESTVLSAPLVTVTDVVLESFLL